MILSQKYDMRCVAHKQGNWSKEMYCIYYDENLEVRNDRYDEFVKIGLRRLVADLLSLMKGLLV
jgi:hypothetical protein